MQNRLLSHLEKVQKLPLEVQTDIVKRVDTSSAQGCEQRGDSGYGRF